MGIMIEYIQFTKGNPPNRFFGPMSSRAYVRSSVQWGIPQLTFGAPVRSANA